MLQSYSAPAFPRLSLPKVISLVNLQQLLGTLNWVCPYFSLPTHLLSPLFDLLTKGKQPEDLIIILPATLATVKQLNDILSTQFVDRIPHKNCQLALLIFPTSKLPMGVLAVLEAQKIYCIEWLYLPHTPSQNVLPFIQAIAEIITLGRT